MKTHVQRTPGVRGQEKFSFFGYGGTLVERRPKVSYIEREPRTAAVAVEMWKSRVLVFGAISKRGGKRGKTQISPPYPRSPWEDFSTLSTARHFHREYSRVGQPENLLPVSVS